MLTIRPETPADFEDLDELLTEAFAFDEHSRQNEARILRALRERGKLPISLVADSDREGVVGQIAFSPVELSDGTPDWAGLGPVSVLPRLQRLGIGRRLMEEGLSLLRNSGARGCVVLGEPAFHGRFGFRQHPQLVLPGAVATYFLAQAFEGEVPEAQVEYDAAFSVA